MAQWSAFQCKGRGFDPWSGSQDSHTPHVQKTKNIKQKQYCHEFNKDLTWSASKKILKEESEAKRFLSECGKSAFYEMSTNGEKPWFTHRI